MRDSDAEALKLWQGEADMPWPAAIGRVIRLSDQPLEEK